MILKIGYTEIKEYKSVSACVDSDELTDMFLLLTTTSSSLLDACEYASNNNWVVGVICEDIVSKDWLSENAKALERYATLNIMLEFGTNTPEQLKQFEEYASICENIVPSLTLIALFPNYFADMFTIQKLCRGHRNIRVTGGHFIALPDCAIGYVTNSHLPKSTSKNNIPLVYENLACIYAVYESKNLDLSFGVTECPYKKSVNKAVERKKAEPKKDSSSTKSGGSSEVTKKKVFKNKFNFGGADNF